MTLSLPLFVEVVLQQPHSQQKKHGCQGLQAFLLLEQEHTDDLLFAAYLKYAMLNTVTHLYVPYANVGSMHASSQRG